MKVLKFGAIWCSGCIVMKPRWAEIEKELPWLTTEYYDVDTQTEMVDKYEVESYPCFVFLDKGGKEICRKYGEIDKKSLTDLVNKYKNF